MLLSASASLVGSSQLFRSNRVELDASTCGLLEDRKSDALLEVRAQTAFGCGGFLLHPFLGLRLYDCAAIGGGWVPPSRKKRARKCPALFSRAF